MFQPASLKQWRSRQRRQGVAPDSRQNKDCDYETFLTATNKEGHIRTTARFPNFFPGGTNSRGRRLQNINVCTGLSSRRTCARAAAFAKFITPFSIFLREANDLVDGRATRPWTGARKPRAAGPKRTAHGAAWCLTLSRPKIFSRATTRPTPSFSESGNGFCCSV